MPAMTYLDDATVRRCRTVLADPECDDLLQELRRVSGEDWIVLVRTHPGRKTLMDSILRQEADPDVRYALLADCHGEWQDINFVRPEGSEPRGPGGSREGVMNYMLGYTAGLLGARYARSLEPRPPEIRDVDTRGIAEVCVSAYQAGAKWEGSWGEAGPEAEHRMRLDDAEVALVHGLPVYVREMEKSLAEAEQRASEAEEDAESVRAETSKILDPEMKDLHLANGGINIAVAGPVVERLALAMVGWFRESGAENYIEMNLNARDNAGEAYVVNVQKRGRKSPHQFRQDAESEALALRKELDLLRTEIGRETYRDNGKIRQEMAVLSLEVARLRATEDRLGKKNNELKKRVYEANRLAEQREAETQQAKAWARAADARVREARLGPPAETPDA